MEEEEVGGRKLALACIKQAVTDLVGIENNGRYRLETAGRAELLAGVKDFFLGKVQGGVVVRVLLQDGGYESCRATQADRLLPRRSLQENLSRRRG